MILDLPEEASKAFEKLLTFVPKFIFVIYQIDNLYEQQNELNMATKRFNFHATHQQTNPGILPWLGKIFIKEDDDTQWFHYQIEIFQNWPVDIDEISRLGVWYVSNKIYQKIIHFFDIVDQIHTNKVKWQLIVTSCYRIMGNFTKALNFIEKYTKKILKCLVYVIVCLQVSWQ